MSKSHSKSVHEVAPGIFQILGHKRAAHTYVIKGRRRTVMIDSGLPSTFEITESCLHEIGLRTSDIDLVLLTHEHIDHAGGAALMPAKCLVAAHRLAANKLALKDEFALMNHAFAINTDHFEVDICLEQGSTIDLGSHELEVIYTPGHCSGAICVYEHRHKVMFTADTIMANGIVGGVLGSGNISDYLNSLRRLRSWRTELLLPGHGQNSTEAEHSIDIGIERLENLLQESREVFNALKNSGHAFDSVMRSLRELNAK
jgi:glyoxylase-like metal-dependent hydrolase (beta-lactamase superfamily II)